MTQCIILHIIIYDAVKRCPFKGLVPCWLSGWSMILGLYEFKPHAGGRVHLKNKPKQNRPIFKKVGVLRVNNPLLIVTKLLCWIFVFGFSVSFLVVSSNFFLSLICLPFTVAILPLSPTFVSHPTSFS